MPILTSNRPGNETLFALDTRTPVRVNLWESSLSGWLVATVPWEENSTLGLLVEGSFVPALYGIPRPDVAEHLKDPGLANCGFYIRFRGPKWNPVVKIVTQGKSGRVVLAEIDVPLVSANSGAAGLMDSYDAWLNGRESSLFWPEKEVYDRLNALPYRPLLSVLLPAFNVDPFLFGQSVQSVHRQKFAHWELCIVDNGSTTSVEHLERLAASDNRTTLVSSPQRLGAAEAQNLALQNAKGDFIVTLDQNDELHPCALLEVIRLLNQRDACEAIYSDEDKIDLYGARSRPVFKADMDPDMLLGSHYTGRFTALKRATVVALGGFRSVCEGAHDWDLLIRLLEKMGPHGIHHLPKPLYHRRVGQAPAAPSRNSQFAARKASFRALADHVARVGKSAVVEAGISPDSLRLRQEAPQSAKVAVFVLREDGSFQIATTRMGMNRSREISLFEVRDFAIYPCDGSSQSALSTLTDISAEVLIFINRPLESLNHLFFEELTTQALREECGLVTGISVNVEKRVLHSGFLHATDGRLVDPYAGAEFSQVTQLGFLNLIRSVEMISEHFFAIRREHLAAVGGLSAVSAAQMRQLVHKLVAHAKQQGLRVIVTPFAIAGFQQIRPEAPVDPVRAREHGGVALNPNLLAFADLAQAVRGAW
jgi:hypothetical protein